MKKILIDCGPHKRQVFEVTSETDIDYEVINGNGKLLFLKEDVSELIEPHKAMELIKEGVKVDRFVVDTWRSASEDPAIFFSGFYRLTPELPEPEYIPFTQEDYSSFFMTARIIVKSDPQTVHAVVGYNDNGILVCSYGLIKYDEALENITFYDGRPFGKEVRNGD